MYISQIFMADIEKITSFEYTSGLQTVRVQIRNNTEAFHEKKLVKFANLPESLS